MAKWSDILEDAIVGRTLMVLIREGFRVEMSDQDGGGLFAYAAPDGGKKPKTGYEYWVRFVPGNGADVISDYTTNLEELLAPVNLFAAQFQD